MAPESIQDGASMNDVPNWDSFSHLSFMLALEKRFGVALHDESIAACKSLSGACQYLRSAGKQWRA
jgi:acyl carrier protein